VRDCGRETTQDNCRSDLISATNVNASSTANVKICVDSLMTDRKAGLRSVICECSRRTTERERRLEVELPIFRGRRFLHQSSYIVKFHERLYLFIFGVLLQIFLCTAASINGPIVKPLIYMAGTPLKPLLNWTCIPSMGQWQ